MQEEQDRGCGRGADSAPRGEFIGCSQGFQHAGTNPGDCWKWFIDLIILETGVQAPGAEGWRHSRGTSDSTLVRFELIHSFIYFGWCDSHVAHTGVQGCARSPRADWRRRACEAPSRPCKEEMRNNSAQVHVT